jgi:hypothetical protein
VHARQRGSVKDDPTIIRHLLDLAALQETVAASSGFANLVRQAAALAAVRDLVALIGQSA